MNRLGDEDFQRAYRYAIALTGDREQAYDVVHTAVTHWLAAPTAAVESPLAYFLRIVRNVFLADVRRAAQMRWSPIEDAEAVIPADLRALEDVQLERAWLERIWGDFTSAEREVLFLWAVEGYTVDEISAQTGAPRGTLLARMHRLRRKFSGDAAGARAGVTP
ncbi:RNA polymerase sigma factor [Aquimonas voraii]|uniref:RNA polymerase sigma-70 factor, ECF subfamily n=1 Tax=Aquimonas voraii TaxID=265719 RepID=A0A1G7AAU9_9GAMM|nr:sigma-70 family RNA polymerase sigma factor [Aquimonas voraii]SDE11921.1 RNA polymerase sigma-70 factor, ECF subfamily [Aquimonas voraii]